MKECPTTEDELISLIFERSLLSESKDSGR